MNTEPQISRILAKQLNLNPRKKVDNSILTAVCHFIWEGYMEGSPIVKSLPKELFCPWDGKMHRNGDCDRKAAFYEKEKSGK